MTTRWIDVGLPAARRRSVWARWLRAQNEVVSVGPDGLSWWDPAGWTCRRRLLPEGASRLYLHAARSGLGADGTLVLLKRGRLVRLRAGSLTATVAVEGLGRKAGSMELCSDGNLVALVSDVGLMRGDVDVWDLDAGVRRWSESPVNDASFSPDGTALLWQIELPQQSGSDVLRYGVRAAQTGEVLGEWRTTCWMEEVAWGPRSRRILYGVHGQSPMAITALRGSSRAIARELIGVWPVPDPPPAVRGWDALEAQMSRTSQPAGEQTKPGHD